MFLATCSRTGDDLRRALLVPAQGDEREDRLPGVLVGLGHDGRLGDLRCATMADSTSAVESRCPETLITSSMRPMIQK